MAGSSPSSSSSAQGRKSSSSVSSTFSASGGRWLVGDLQVVPARADRRHQHPPRVQVVVLVGVGQRADDPDLEPRLRQSLGHPLAPLDDGDGVVERGVEIEVVELVDAAEAVGVDVHQVGPSASEGWTRAITNVGEVTSPRTPSPAPRPCVNVVLPAPSSPLSTIRSPAASSAARPTAELAHRLGVRDVDR